MSYFKCNTRTSLLNKSRHTVCLVPSGLKLKSLESSEYNGGGGVGGGVGGGGGSAAAAAGCCGGGWF